MSDTTVFVVEDDASIRDSLSLLLKQGAEAAASTDALTGRPEFQHTGDSAQTPSALDRDSSP